MKTCMGMAACALEVLFWLWFCLWEEVSPSSQRRHWPLLQRQMVSTTARIRRKDPPEKTKFAWLRKERLNPLLVSCPIGPGPGFCLHMCVSLRAERRWLFPVRVQRVEW